MKKTKLFIITCVVLIAALALCLPTIASAVSRDEAVQWAEDAAANGTGYNHPSTNYGYQCSDFVTCYMNWLVTGDPYSWTYLPQMAYSYGDYCAARSDNWEVITNYAEFVPEPGDIFVSTAGQYGHVGIVISSDMYHAWVVDQNSDAQANKGAQKRYITWSGDYKYYIRFKHYSGSSSTPANPAFNFVNDNKMFFINERTAQIGYIRITGNVNLNSINTSGCELANASGQVLGTHEEGSYHQGSEIIHYWRVNGDPNESDVCYTLSPGTSYKIRSYVIYNGQKYYSDWIDFKTSGAANPEFYFTDDHKLETIGDTSGQIGYIRITSNGYINDISTTGCELADRNGNVLQTHEEGSYHQGSEIIHYWRINGDPNDSDLCYTLTPGTNYKIRSYVIYNGQKYYSDWMDFKSTGTAKVTVTFDGGGASNVPNPITVDAGSNITIPDQRPTMRHYWFSYWTDGDHQYQLGQTASFTSDTTLQAAYEWEYIYTFDLNGGTGNFPEITSLVEILQLPTNAPTRDGYTFVEWNNRSDGNGQYHGAPGQSISAPDETVFYAIWQQAASATSVPVQTPTPETEHDSTSQDEIALLSSSASTVQDDGTFTVTLGLNSNPGIAGLTISSDFATQGLTLVSTEAIDIAANAQVAGGTRISLMTDQNMTGSGEILRLVFKASQKQDVNLSFNVDRAVNENGESVAVFGTTVSAYAASSSRTPGDANDDGIVDIVDAMMVLRYDCGWNVSVNLSNSDVNADGIVDIVDAMMILRYDCGWNVTLQ